MTDILFLDAATLRDVLPMNACIAAMRDAMISASKSSHKAPIRRFISLPDHAASLGTYADLR